LLFDVYALSWDDGLGECWMMEIAGGGWTIGFQFGRGGDAQGSDWDFGEFSDSM
jgi:hypothetical protein